MCATELDGGEWSASCPTNLYPEKEPLVPTEQEAGWHYSQSGHFLENT